MSLHSFNMHLSCN